MTPVKDILKLLSATLLLAACAKQGMPSGGPKDVAPPVVIRTSPLNESLSFNESLFSVEFDEYVVLKDVDNNLIVSPPMNPKPEVKTKGHGIVVRLRDSLRVNTTYSFQFLSAIADYNEGNILPSFVYVFSTGEAIDSMMIMGNVQDALSLKPQEEPVAVMLCDDTLGVRYQTRSLKDGSFTFSHIAPGNYKLLAIRDENKNLKLDTTEACAWLDTLVAASLDSIMHPLLISTPLREKQRIISSEFLSRERIRIVAKCPMTSPTILCDSLLHWQLNPQGDTLLLWAMSRPDSLHLVLSDPSGLHDTVRLRFRSLPRTSPAVTPKLKPNFSSTMPYFDTLRFLLQLPVSMTDTLFHYLSSDSTEEGFAHCLPSSPLPQNLAGDTLYASLAANWRPTPGKTYALRLMSIDTISLNLHITKPEDYGNIHLSAPDGWLYQLLDDKDNVMPSFSNLKPGKYRIRAIDDRDGNGQWTPGDYFSGRQPERVLYYAKTLDVRANWDMEEIWNLR